MFWLSVNWIFEPFVINHHERRKVHAQETSQLSGGWVPHDIRDAVVDFVRQWSQKAEIALHRFISWLSVARSKFYRNAPYSLKLKVSNSMEPSAVKYLASSVDTPPDILKKLASHPSRDVAESSVHTTNCLIERKRIQELYGNDGKGRTPNDEK